MKSMVKNRWRFLGLLLLIALVIVSCGSTQTGSPAPTPTTVATEPPTPTITVDIPNVDIKVDSKGNPIFDPTDITFTGYQGQTLDFIINNPTTTDRVIFTSGDNGPISVTNNSDFTPVPSASMSVSGINSTIYTIPAASSVMVGLTNYVETYFYLTANGFSTEKEYTSKLTVHPPA